VDVRDDGVHGVAATVTPGVATVYARDGAARARTPSRVSSRF
jgi:hypothetical protein